MDNIILIWLKIMAYQWLCFLNEEHTKKQRKSVLHLLGAFLVNGVALLNAIKRFIRDLGKIAPT